jgi:hypothetical protein
MKRTNGAFIILASLSLIFLSPSAHAAVKSGAACKKVGQTVVESGKKYQCVKSGGKLLWSKGLPTANPTPQKKDEIVASSSSWPNPDAKYITAVPVDLNQINSISKYASCSGHNRDGYTFDKTLVSNLSLKHYWYPIASLQGTTDKVKVFAPFDGTVSVIQLEADKGGLGRPQNGNGLGLSTSIDKNVVFSFGHIYFTKQYKLGDNVKAGDLLGFASMSDPGFDFDIDLVGKSRAVNNSEILGSIFDHMTKEVLATFAEHGITQSDMKISLAERQSHPCDFSAGTGRTTADWVALKGETIAAGVPSSQSNSGNSDSGAKPGETQKPEAPNNSGGPVFQQVGESCDPTKGTSGKAADGTQLACKVGSDGKSSWQKK